MPLETANFLPDLVTSNPAHSDGLNNADAHLRMLKAVLKATFPNFTDVALASTQAQIDAATAAVVTNGVSRLSESGAMFNTNTTDGVTNPSAGTVGVSTGGTVATNFTNNGIGTTQLAASVGITGPGAVPIGTILPWAFNTLPSGSGVWAWCNGQAISRTTYASAFALFNADGLLYGTGDGSTTFNLPNYQDVTLVGKDTMGGAASPGLLTSIATGVKNILGKIFGSDTHTLTTTEMPSHNHGINDPGHTHVTNAQYVGGGGTIGLYNPGLAGYAATNNPATTGITIQNNGGGAAHNITQPSMTVNYIIRIA